MDLLLQEETFAIRGAIFEVHKEIGAGFLEAVYQECLERELRLRNIPFKKQVEIQIEYKGKVLNHFYKADLLCYESIIVEIKACKELCQIHRAQVMNYLKATKLQLGLLVNFNTYPKARIERIIL